MTFDALPCVITRFAPVTVTTGLTTVHCVLPVPPHPTVRAEGVGSGGVAVAVILVIVPRPLWSLFPRSAFVLPGCAATGFCPGDICPCWFVQSYETVPVT